MYQTQPVSSRMGDAKGMAQFRFCRLPSLKASLVHIGIPIPISISISIFLDSPADTTGTVHGSAVGIGMVALDNARQLVHVGSERAKALSWRDVGSDAKRDGFRSCILCEILTQSARVRSGIGRG
jgi:hypothetical protein